MNDLLEGFEVVNPSSAIIGGDARCRMGRVVLAFIESGNECMAKRYSDKQSLFSDTVSARSFARYRNLDVKVRRRGDMLFLIKGDKQ